MTPPARQWAAVRIRFPEPECNTEPLQVCSSVAPRNTAPTLGLAGTGLAVGGPGCRCPTGCAGRLHPGAANASELATAKISDA